MQEIVLTIGIVAYALFAIQFIGSLLGYETDFDFDVNFDGIPDFSVSDLVSFKGIIHFVMGFVAYFYPEISSGATITIWTWIISIIVGLIFVIGLYYIYHICMRIQHTPKREEGELKDRYVEILRHERELTYIGATTINGAYDHFTVEASEPLIVGNKYKIKKFINNKIYI